MSYKFIAPNSEQPKDESAGPETQEKLAVPEVKFEPAVIDEMAPVTAADYNAFEKRIADKQREPAFNDLKVRVFKSHGFVIVQYNQPIPYMTLTKKQAKEFARLLVKEAL